jgi:hypothetical protein
MNRSEQGCSRRRTSSCGSQRNGHSTATEPKLGSTRKSQHTRSKRRISDRLLEASRQMNCFELEKQRSDSRLNSIVAHLRGIVERRRAFVQQRRRIHLANGVFAFHNGGELLDFSPAFV